MITTDDQQLNQAQTIRKKLILRNLQEVLGEDKLTKHIITGKNIHIYWGTATTGRPHVGYFVPIQKIADFLRADIRVTILFADLHAFLDNLKSSFELLENRVIYYECVIKALMSAMDVPIDKLSFVRGQSYQLTESYTKDLLQLSSMISLRDAVRAGAEVVKQMEDPFLSGILYPLLQALDEQYLKVDGQFGGVDQRKIFILAEEQLPKLKLGKRFHLMNPMVPGLTGSKMSSSEENTKIDLLDLSTTVNAKIDTAFCPKTGTGEENGILAFYKYVVFPILGQENLILNGNNFPDYIAVQSAFDDNQIGEQALKDFLKSFLNNILSKVQGNCYNSPSFTEVLLKAYPPKSQIIEEDNYKSESSMHKETIFTIDGPFGDRFKFIPSATLQKYPFSDGSLFDNRPLKILWKSSPKGAITLAHLKSLLHLRFLKSLGCECLILISDLGAFLDKNKCSWKDLSKRTVAHAKALQQILVALGIDNIPIKFSSEYQFKDSFTLEMYKFVSVVTKEETALIEGGNTVGCHLCPIYFALDIHHANADMVLIGSHQEKFAQLFRKINKVLKFPDDQHPAFLIMPEIIGTDGQRMSATKPDFNLDLQDGMKKVRQKIAKSFCEPGNLIGNVALELCKNFIFPFYKHQMQDIAVIDSDNIKALTIERTPENGGNLDVLEYQELEQHFVSLKLHPADLKTFLCAQINHIFDSIRNGRDPCLPTIPK